MRLFLLGLCWLPLSVIAAWPGSSGQQLSASGCSRALHLHVHELEVQHKAESDEHWGAMPHWLVLDLEFENAMAPDLLLQLNYPEAVELGPLSRQLFLVINDRIVLRPDVGFGTMNESFVLSSLGSSRRGKLRFPWPGEPVERVSLYYAHDRLGSLEVVLQGQERIIDDPAETQAIESHGLLEMSVSEVSFPEQVDGRQPPDGKVWLMADVSGRSRWQLDRPARLENFHVPLDARSPFHQVFEYRAAERLLVAVVDGEQAFPRQIDLGTLEPEPVFLPDRWAGGRAVFSVPADADSIELVAYSAVVDGEGIDRHEPEPLRFQLRGRPQRAVVAQPLFQFEDGPLHWAAHRMRLVDQIGPVEAGDDDRLLAVEFSVRNAGSGGGLLRVISRFDVVTAETASVIAAEALAQGRRYPKSEPFWVPAGESRRFEIVFRLPSTADPAQICYRGVTGSFEGTLTPN